MYFKVVHSRRASKGVSDYTFALIQLAQTTLRSEIGKIELDRTFEERTNINIQVVNELGKVSDSWGVKVLRYVIKNITSPKNVLNAIEKQMWAVREKRALILTSKATVMQRSTKPRVRSSSRSTRRNVWRRPSLPSSKPRLQVSTKLPKRFKFCETRKSSSCASPSSRSTSSVAGQSEQYAHSVGECLRWHQ